MNDKPPDPSFKSPKSAGPDSYPTQGGCVFCTYEIEAGKVEGKHYVSVTPATNRVQTKNGPRDLCPDHAREVTEIQPKRYPWEGPEWHVLRGGRRP